MDTAYENLIKHLKLAIRQLEHFLKTWLLKVIASVVKPLLHLPGG